MDDDQFSQLKSMLHNALQHIYNLEIRLGSLENYILNAGKPEGMSLQEAQKQLEATRQLMTDRYKEWTDILDDPKDGD